MADLSSREQKKSEIRRKMISPEAENDKAEEELQSRRKRRGIKTGHIVLAILLLILAGTAAFIAFNRFYRYSEYSTVWSRELSEGSFVGYESFGEHLIKYSKDGASYINRSGESIWIQSYEMKNPHIAVNGSYAAIADIQGNTIDIYGKEGRSGTAHTLLPVTRVSIAANGTVAAVVEDSLASYITFFAKDGTALDITIKTILSGDGYPTDISLSPEGTQLIVSYVYIANSELKSRVVFYDFSEIGKNIPNRLVGGFDEPFAAAMPGRVKFMDAENSVAVTDGGIYFFSSKNLASPKLTASSEAGGEIESICFGSGRIGMIIKGAESGSEKQLRVYSPDGRTVFKKNFDYDYREFDIDGDYICLYSPDSMLIYNMAGTEKFRGDTDFQIADIREGGLPGEFILTGPSRIEKIRLR